MTTLSERIKHINAAMAVETSAAKPATKWVKIPTGGKNSDVFMLNASAWTNQQIVALRDALKKKYSNPRLTTHSFKFVDAETPQIHVFTRPPKSLTKGKVDKESLTKNLLVVLKKLTEDVLKATAGKATESEKRPGGRRRADVIAARNAKKPARSGKESIKAPKGVSKLKSFMKENNIDLKTLKALVKHVTPKKETASAETASLDKTLNGAEKTIAAMSTGAARALLKKADKWFEWDNAPDVQAAMKGDSKKIAAFILENGDPIGAEGGLIDFLIDTKVIKEAEGDQAFN